MSLYHIFCRIFNTIAPNVCETAWKALFYQKIAALKKTFEDCEGIYEVYRDIADTYYSIAKGNYVSKLAEKEREKRRKTTLQ